MDLPLALQCFAVMLTLICIALVPFVIRHEPKPMPRIVSIAILPRCQWPGVLTRAGIVCLLVSFALLIAACCLLLDW